MTTRLSLSRRARYSAASAYSWRKPCVVKSPEQTTTSGSRSFTSRRARSSRLATKWGDPRCRSEMCATRNTGRANGTGISVPGATVVPVAAETVGFQAYCGSEPPRFVNRSELEVAKLLDFYGIPWDYEPRSFVLEEDEDGRVVEAARPDFYLPEQDLYLELTTMKQSLVTRKNRKIRKLRERYPEVKVKLFYKRDFERLVEKYGLDLAS